MLSLLKRVKRVFRVKYVGTPKNVAVKESNKNVKCNSFWKLFEILKVIGKTLGNGTLCGGNMSLKDMLY